MTDFTPKSIISGRVTAGRGRELDAAIAAASMVLGTQQLACISSRVGDTVWYLCAPAADLASHTHSSSPLAAALPGTPDHQGDGAYTLRIVSGKITVRPAISVTGTAYATAAA